MDSLMHEGVLATPALNPCGGRGLAGRSRLASILTGVARSRHHQILQRAFAWSSTGRKAIGVVGLGERALPKNRSRFRRRPRFARLRRRSPVSRLGGLRGIARPDRARRRVPPRPARARG
jgi:hypothetical protein